MLILKPKNVKHFPVCTKLDKSYWNVNCFIISTFFPFINRYLLKICILLLMHGLKQVKDFKVSKFKHEEFSQ